MKRLKPIAVILILPFLAGCWDRMEINDLGLVMATGLDLEKKGNIKATVQIAVPSPSSQAATGTSKEADSFFLISAVGKNGLDLDKKLQQYSSRKLFYSHRSMILVGESLARHGISGILDTFGRNPRNRMRTFIVVVKGRAESLLQARYPYELVPGEAMKEMETLKGMGVDSTLRDYLIASAGEGVSPAVGVLEPTKLYRTSQKKKDKQFRLRDTAVFKNERMVGFLNNRETHQLLWFRKRKKTDNITADLPDGKGNVGLTLTGAEIKYKVIQKGGRFLFDIRVKGTGNLLENNSRLDVGLQKNLNIITKALESRVKHDMLALMHKIQTEFKADIVGFGSQLQRQDPHKWRAVAKRWDRYFASADVSVSVELTINNSGAIGPSLQLEDKEVEK